MSKHDLNRRRLSKFLAEDSTNRSLSRASDVFTAKGSVVLTKVYSDGRREIVVHDPNLVVTMGRRVMSRLIGGVVTSPTIVEGVQPVLRIIRDTTGSPDRAYAEFQPVEGTNEYQFRLLKDVGGTITAEYASGAFAGGAKTISQLVTEINAVTGYRYMAEVVGALGNTDAVTLLPVLEADCLGDAASYTQAFEEPYARTLYAAVTAENSVEAADLYVDRIRFGTEGHDPDTPTVGKDVLMSDEQLSVKLRAAELGYSTEAEDYLPVTVSYPNTGHIAFTSSLDLSSANGLNISEVGLFTPTYIVAKKNFGQILKSPDFSLEITWTLIF